LTSSDGNRGLTQQSFDIITETIVANNADAWSYKLCAVHIE